MAMTTLEEAKEVCAQGWPENQRMQRRFDVEQWLISEVERLSKPKGFLVVDHNGMDNDADYGVSFSGFNPELQDYVKCATEEDAIRLVEILSRA
jgi:hypothetical protein